MVKPMEKFCTCRRCKKRVIEQYSTEVITVHFLDFEKVCLCQSCYKSFIRFMEGKILDGEEAYDRNNGLKIAVERKRRKQRKSMAKDAVEMETDLVYESDEEDYE